MQGIHDQINGLDDFVSISWNGVNMKPAKQGKQHRHDYTFMNGNLSRNL